MTNTVTIDGNLTRDPELKFMNDGTALCELGVAVNRRWRNQQTNEWDEKVSFFNVTAWKQLGENAAESLSKGDHVIVTGRLDQRTWDKDDGSKGYAVSIVADVIGAGLRWATVVVTKNPKRGGFNDPSDPGPSPDFVSAGAPSGDDRPPASAYDEEPF